MLKTQICVTRPHCVKALFCVVSRACRVELLAVTSTSLPYFLSGLTFVLYVVFIVSCVFPHVALASRFMSFSLWLTISFSIRLTLHIESQAPLKSTKTARTLVG